MATVIGFLLGVAAGLLANRVYEYLRRADLIVEEDPADPRVGRRSYGNQAFFHVVVRPRIRWPAIGARPPQSVRAVVKITDSAGRVRVDDKPGRWVAWPEPLTRTPLPAGPGAVLIVQGVDQREIRYQQTINFLDLEQLLRLDIAVKIEGQRAIHFWNNECYEKGLMPEHTLEEGDYQVLVTLRYEGTRVSYGFELSNRGTSWRDVRLRSIGQRLP